jgi:hypothetical protein
VYIDEIRLDKMKLDKIGIKKQIMDRDGEIYGHID